MDIKTIIKEHRITVNGQRFDLLVGMVIGADGPVSLNPEYHHTDWRRYYLTGQSYQSLERNLINRYRLLESEKKRLVSNILDYSKLDFSGAENRAIADKKREERRVRTARRHSQVIKKWIERTVK